MIPMKRPLAYITAPWSENEFENTENAAKYCRAVYDAGFSPVCPTLFLPLFLRDEIPQEHKDCIDMAREYLRRARVLVVCGSTVNESVKNDIAVAERLRITATFSDNLASRPSFALIFCFIHADRGAEMNEHLLHRLVVPP